MRKNFTSISLAYIIKIKPDAGSEEDLPINEKRVKVRIPSLHGPLKEDMLPPGVDPRIYFTPDESLPWAQVMYPIGSVDPKKESLLKEGEIVYVLFPSTDNFSSPIVVGTTGTISDEFEGGTA